MLPFASHPIPLAHGFPPGDAPAPCSPHGDAKPALPTTVAPRPGAEITPLSCVGATEQTTLGGTTVTNLDFARDGSLGPAEGRWLLNTGGCVSGHRD